MIYEQMGLSFFLEVTRITVTMPLRFCNHYVVVKAFGLEIELGVMVLWIQKSMLDGMMR